MLRYTSISYLYQIKADFMVHQMIIMQYFNRCIIYCYCVLFCISSYHLTKYYSINGWIKLSISTSNYGNANTENINNYTAQLVV